MLKKILSILMLTMIATTTIVRAELWLPDSDDSDEGLLINDPVTDTQVTESPMKTVASKAYVDTKIETKQLKIPAAGQPNVGAGETVMTYTAAGNGQIGERGLYSDISSYNATTDGDKLITASALNATFTNLPTTPTTKLECANQADGCTLWTIVDQSAYGNGLPSGYTRLEYIQSTGTQYIDTGAPYKSSRIYNVDFQYVVYPDGAKGSLGARQTTGAGTGTFDIGCNQTVFYFYNNSTSANRKEPRDLARHTVEIDYTNSVFKFDGEILPWLAGTGAWQGTYNVYIGRENIAGSPNTSVGTVKWYSYKVYDNGTLVQNLVPAKNSSNVLGMYDTVSSTFFTNAATDGPDFTAGPPVQ